MLPLETHLPIVCNMFSAAKQVCVMSSYIFIEEIDAVVISLVLRKR